jgi:restriction system protein
MARSILCRLNDAGEAALANRREVIKRISEFDDFSSCWDGDRLKAQGLVSQIQKLVNIKASFTRINLEKAEERTTIKDALYKLFGETDPSKRGERLEGALNSLFSFAGVLVREAFVLKGQPGQGIIEQIDGAVEIDGVLYLVEMKWWDKPIGRQEIAPHLVSVYGRGDVGGIFISYSGFSPAAIEDAKTGLAQKFSS